jgi:glutathione S-transferase
MSTPKIQLYCLQASRSIRIAWLLEVLDLPYETHFYPRVNNKAPASFKQDSGNPLGKAPVLKDGNLTLTESGAITEYLVDKYDKQGQLMGGGDEKRQEKIRAWIHAAEGTFLLHALSITYARWFSPKSVQDSGELTELEKGLAINIGRDLDWLESELKANAGRFLVGDGVTAADTMNAFGIQFVFARDLSLGRKVSEWPAIEKWLKDCEDTQSWKKAVQKTGHDLIAK